MAKHKIAIIGLGKIAQDQHLPVIDKNSDFELVGVTSQRGLGHGAVPSFKTPAEMYAAVPDIEAVAICTPPDVRHAIARQAIDAGKDVLLEKPPAATLAEFADLEAYAASKGRVLFATWHSQFNPAVDATKALLAEAGVKSIRIEWREDVKKWHPGQDWVWEPGGFGVFDPGINALSIFVKIMPTPPFVKSAELTYPANRQTPIGAKLVFSSADPANPTLTADFDWREQGDEKWHMMIETGDGRRVRLYKGGTILEIDGKIVVEAPSEEYERIYVRFAELLDKRESDVDGAPLRLVADAMLVGRRQTTDAFDW
ncbi:Gfo/Idh/MocA family oxidoreductase [Kaistia dalseonensis]|uniref:D-galactose 1-dehydrogenase n=1 Tax=Kaistia dalseonensis TaxID=410840 RepID=A0ABU0H4B1_9HYPH|nr:Gfo/Idh/MocA family oxidoreductase [Kaistia dalseonensis]MCX5494568.1 Gfo/Idh/MocA family oxidoreductase [Kaistia dalseonensis]MDQ0437148.1 D-galactose 1-dehydrogenase [Kaistia dalseonensis]